MEFIAIHIDRKVTFIAPLGTLHNKCPAKPHFVAEKKNKCKNYFDKVR